MSGGIDKRSTSRRVPWRRRRHDSVAEGDVVEDLAVAAPEQGDTPDGVRPLWEVSVPDPSGASDWGFSADEPGGALGGGMRHWYFWWTGRDQEGFERCWGPRAEEEVAALVDSFGAAWPWVTARALRAHAPDVVSAVGALAESITATSGRELPSYRSNRAAMVDTIITWGSFQLMRSRLSWAPSHYQVCPVCHRRFWTGELAPWTYFQFGPGRYCFACCKAARDGDTAGPSDPDRAARALRRLADALGSIPPQRVNQQALPVDLEAERRDEIVRALQATPPPAALRVVLGAEDWLGVLQRAGIVGESWRPSKGTWCRAVDGHRCRSLLEKSIDDWLYRHGLDHEPEPRWPAHEVFNPTGRKRADWRLSDGTFVECAGLITDPGYAQKIEEKRQLADHLGVPLVVIVPSDLLRLEIIFARLPRPRG